jgi:hypothetical protein
MNGEQLAFDTHDSYLLLYGGYNPNGSLSASWKFTSSGWHQLSTTGSPPGLNLGTMAFDAHDRYVVLFGGNENGISNTGPTLTYQSGMWNLISPSPTPSGRSNAISSYDTADGYVLLFGGCGPANTNGVCTPDGDTWTFRGGNWSMVNTSVSPSPRWGQAMAWDPGLGGVVLFGGCISVVNNACTGAAHDTWLFKNGSWTRLKTAFAPPGRYGAGMAYDPRAGGMVLFGGSRANNSVLNDTWILKGNHWVHFHPGAMPSGRYRVRMVYDPILSELVLFAGSTFTTYDFNDTWVLR